MPQVTWLKDGQALLEAGDPRIVSSGQSLHISEAQLLDTGRYTCLASNTAGDRSKTYSLNVLGEQLACLCQRNRVLLEFCRALMTAVHRLPVYD